MRVVHAHQMQVIDCAIDADIAHQDLCGGSVVGIAHGAAEGLRSLISAAAVILRPGVLAAGILPAGDRHRHVIGNGSRGRAKINCRSIDRQRLDGRTDGHVHIACAVKRFACSRLVASADNGLQFTGAVVIDAGGRLWLLNLGIGAVGVARLIDLVGRIAQAGIVFRRCQRVFKNLLNLRIQTQVYAVAAGAQLVFHSVAVGGGILKTVEIKECVNHIVDRVFDVMRIIVHIRRRRGGLKHVRRASIKCGLIFLCGDKTVFAHLPQRIICAVVGDVCSFSVFGAAGVEIAARIVVVGAAGHAGKHSAFAQGQLAELFAEVAVSCNLHAVVAAAKEDGIEIAFKNLVFGIARFKLHGQIRFLQLTLVALLAGEHGHFDELLSDGGAALRGAGGEVGNQRADNALDVHAVVLVKAGVLHGDEGVAEHSGDLVDGNHDAVFGALIIGDEIALAVIDEGGLVLCVKRRQIQRGRSIHISLGDADQRAGQRQTGTQNQQDTEANRGNHHAQQKVGVLCAGLEDGVSRLGASCLFLFFALFAGDNRRRNARGCRRGGLPGLICHSRRHLKGIGERSIVRREHGRLLFIFVLGHAGPPYEGEGDNHSSLLYHTILSFASQMQI